MKKTIRLLSMLVAAVFLCFTMTGCINLRKFYSVEHHLEYISNRIEESYLQPHHTGYEVYPLYNENDEMQYALVEFEPYGFLFVFIADRPRHIIRLSMYIAMNSGVSETWYPYTLDKGAESVDWSGITLETNEGGVVHYNRSPYNIRNVQDEKMYLLYISQKGTDGYVPAVKRGEKYLNTTTMEEFVFQPQYENLEIEIMLIAPGNWIMGFTPHAYFNL